MNFKTLIIFFVGVIIAKLFLSWLIIIPALVILLIAWGYKAMAATNQIGPKWAKRLTVIGVTLLAIFYGLMFASYKWPWLTNAINNRQTYFTYRVTDLIEPKYPGDLAESLYKTRMLLVQAEEEKQKGILNSLQEKIADNKPLTDADLKSIQAARNSLLALKDSLADIRLARDSAETKFSFNFPSLPSLNQNMVIAGLIALIFLAIILCFIFKNRKARVALVYLAILSFIGLTIWVNKGHGPKNASAGVQTATPPSHQWSKVIYFNLNPGETIDTGIHYEPNDVIGFFQPDDPPATFYFVGQNKTCEVKEKARNFRGLAPSGDIWLKAGPQPVRVGVSVHR